MSEEPWREQHYFSGDVVEFGEFANPETPARIGVVMKAWRSRYGRIIALQVNNSDIILT